VATKLGGPSQYNAEIDLETDTLIPDELIRRE